MAKRRKAKKSLDVQTLAPPPSNYSRKAITGLAIAVLAGISFAAYAGNDILHGHVKVTRHPIPSKENVSASHRASEPTASSFHNHPSNSSDLANKYGDIATSPAVADAIRKFDNNNTSDEAGITDDTSQKAFEEFAYRMAMQRVGRGKPPKHRTLLNISPSQTAVMAQQFPSLLADLSPPDPKEIIMQLVSPPEASEYGMPLNPSSLRAAAMTQQFPSQLTNSSSPPSEETIAGMAGDPLDPMASIWPDKVAAKAANQKFFEEYTREHDGPIHVPVLQRDHNWLAKHARKTANGYVSDNGYAEDIDRQSVVGVTDENGDEVTSIQYDPWGNHTILSGGTTMPTFGFQGMYYHEPSGLYLTLNRVYSPKLGRWLSRDPLGEAAGTNLYTFVRNNPISYRDPLGLDVWVEGSAGEPEAFLHQSINVGDPMGAYYSQSFGVSGWGKSAIYVDDMHGGVIFDYAKSTPAQDRLIKQQLRKELGPRPGYNVFVNQCRTYSQAKFNDITKQYGLTPSASPERPIQPWAYTQLIAPSGLSTTTASFTKK